MIGRIAAALIRARVGTLLFAVLVPSGATQEAYPS